MKRRISSSCVYRVNPCNGEVNIVKSMDQQRCGASAVVCGHEILVFGGLDTTREDEVLSTCEKYFLSRDKLALSVSIAIGG